LADIVDRRNPDFLDWSDVQGASSYEYNLIVVPEAEPTRYVHSYRIPETPVPPDATPPSSSQINPAHVHFSHVYDGDRNHFTIRVAALDRSPIPRTGKWSEERRFVLENYPTITPMPTIAPTPNLDLDDSDKFEDPEAPHPIEHGDFFRFLLAWYRSSYDPIYHPLADMSGDNYIDGKDLLLIMGEALRRNPFPAPSLISPATGTRISFVDAQTEGITFRWSPVPDTLGGASYQLQVYGPFDVTDSGVRASPDARSQDIKEKTFETEFHSLLSLILDPEYPWYEWRVRVSSPYGIKPASYWAARYFQIYDPSAE
jgi:hypothetical protein